MGQCLCKKNVFSNDWKDSNCCNFYSYFSLHELVLEYDVRYNNIVYNFDCSDGSNYKYLYLYKINHNPFNNQLLANNISIFYSAKDSFIEIYNKSIKVIDNLCFL